jgi:hypothetical protein
MYCCWSTKHICTNIHIALVIAYQGAVKIAVGIANYQRANREAHARGVIANSRAKPSDI